MLLVAANQVVGLDLDIHSHPDLVVVSPCSIGSLNRGASLQCRARARSSHVAQAAAFGQERPISEPVKIQEQRPGRCSRPL